MIESKIETFETYDFKEKTRLIAIEFMIGDRGIIQSHGATYLNMRNHMKGKILYGLDNPRARVCKRQNVKNEY